jgi:hypothetical protein
LSAQVGEDKQSYGRGEIVAAFLAIYILDKRAQAYVPRTSDFCKLLPKGILQAYAGLVASYHY